MKKIVDWYYGKASIRKKLVISYLILVLIPLTVLGGYSYRNAIHNLIEQTRDAVSGNVSIISYTLQTSIDREDDNLKYLSYNKEFRERLEAGKKNTLALAQELNRSVEPVFWYFIASDRNMKGLEIFSPHIDRDIGSFLKTEDACEEEKWFAYHQTEFGTLWSFDGERLYATRTLLDADTSSEPIGIMKLEVYPERFVESLYKSQFLENGVALLDGEGRMIGHRGIADERLEEKIIGSIHTGTKPGLYETDQYILAVGSAFSNGWQMFYYIDKAEIAGDMNRIFRNTLLMVGLCLMLITVLISLISRFLSSRILKLKQCAEKVGTGDFDVAVETGYTDEIGVVADSFAVMCNKINEMMNQMYQMGLEKRATELKALQAMINPHFLYNCLSSIKWKAIRSDQDEIADITGHLAKFYRTSLNEGKQITVVEKELENIKSYLELQSRMHEDSFDVEYQISREGLGYEMPNFLLQPIVENAICHGIDYCEEGERGLIRIVYAPEESYLVFRVYNNGPELEAEQLEKILKEPGKGYGICNIQERIRMYYDDTCGVSAGVENGLVCFTIRIKNAIGAETAERVR
ncbi:MAG: histidine kinase [Lachnospiraceae bacterium]|nr:histidine kinase [Lachnospiraceae bacterium]